MTEQTINKIFQPNTCQDQKSTENKEIAKVEQQLLACIIRDSNLISEIPRLQSIDFTDTNNASINSSLLSMLDTEQKSINFLTLAATMELAGKNTNTLSILESLTVNSSLLSKYADLIIEGSRHRQVKAAASLLATEPESKTHASALAKALEIGFGQKTVSSTEDSMNSFLTELEKKTLGENPPAATGLLDLDEKLDGGFYGSELIVLAARPGVGKTALALGIAESVSSSPDNNKRALFVSLEMSNYQLMSRRITAISRGRVPLSALRKGVITQEHHDELFRLKEILEASRLDLIASHSLDIDGLIDTIKTQAKRDELGLVVIDYLQLISSGKDASEYREQQVAQICRKLKQLANSLNIPILLLSQLNRETEKGGAAKRPKLSNLRESGSIEQDADTVIFIYKEDRPKYSIASSGGEPVVIIVEKQRQGESGVDVNAVWHGSECRFTTSGTAGYSHVKPGKLDKVRPIFHTNNDIDMEQEFTEKERIILLKIQEMNDNVAIMNGDLTNASDTAKAVYAKYQNDSNRAIANDPYSQYQ
jgi:replicative DNA helicase